MPRAPTLRIPMPRVPTPRVPTLCAPTTRMPTLCALTLRVPTRVPTTRRTLLFLLACGVALTGLPATAQTLLATLPTGSHPVALATNPANRKLYVANQYSNNVTVIDEASYASVTIPVGTYPTAIAANPVSNKIYVANQNGNSVTVIDGATNSTATVATGRSPTALAINSVTNQIYVANYYGNSITAIKGSNNSTVTIAVGNYPTAIALDPVTNKIYVANLNGYTVTVIDGVTGGTTTVPVGTFPNAVAVNPLSNKIYVTNGSYFAGAGTVTVIDGATNSTTVVPVGLYPNALAVNLMTNQIYVVNAADGTVTVIDGATNFTQTTAVGSSPGLVAVDPVIDKIYVSNDLAYGGLTMIDGATGSTTTIAVLGNPYALAVDPANHRVYTGNLTDNTVAVIAVAWAPTALQFVPATPCRVVDTRNPNGEFGGPAIGGGNFRDFIVPDNLSCGIPATAAAYSLNVAVVPHGGLGYLTMWPTGEDQPVVSTLNSLDGRVKADAAIVPAGASGQISVYVTDTTNVILDIDGYFAPVSGSTLAFYPLAPCRVADTRKSNFPQGLGPPQLSAKTPRDFPVLTSPCIPSGVNPAAYSFNFTVVPGGHPVGYLSVWPTGQSQPVVSTLNDRTGTIVANAAIVPAGTGGDISVYSTDDTQLLIDIDGYFAPAGQGGLSLYGVQPCRVIDTRRVGSGQPFSGTLSPPVDVVDTGCAASSLAQAYVFNATVVPVGALGYLTLWPDGSGQPVVSTLNAFDGAITNNMAIVPAGNQGEIDAYANGLTQLILDISSYFAP